MLRTLIPNPSPRGEKGANPNVSFRTPKSRRPAIDTGDPRTIFTKVSINVVHTNRIPSGTARHEYRTRSHFFFDVACGGQLLNLEGANLRPINRNAVLRKPDQFSIERQNSSSRPGVVLVPSHDRVRRMFAPRAEKFIREIKPQRVV